MCRRRRWSEKKVRAEEALAGHVSQLEAAKLRALVLELVITRSAYSTWGALALGKRLLEAAKLYGVDAKKIEAAVKAEIAASKGKRQHGSYGGDGPVPAPIVSLFAAEYADGSGGRGIERG